MGKNRRVITVEDGDGGTINIHVEQISAVAVTKKGYVLIHNIVRLDNPENCKKFLDEYYAWLNEDTE